MAIDRTVPPPLPTLAIISVTGLKRFVVLVFAHRIDLLRQCTPCAARTARMLKIFLRFMLLNVVSI